MKLEIMSGQKDATFIGLNFLELTKDCNPMTDVIMKYPERNICHPKKLYDYMRKDVKDCIENNRNLFILTYSDHALNAVRVEIKKYGFDGAMLHQITNNGEDICSPIHKDGRIDTWVPDIFDVWDRALQELL